MTDGVLYWAHRLFHRPALFRLIHRHHHRFLSPTAFTAAATHPVELRHVSSADARALLFVPLLAAGVVAVLVYHTAWPSSITSGVDLHLAPLAAAAALPRRSTTYFHVNYGQTLGVWDRVFGTHRREGRVYGIDIFGGKGAPRPGARAGEPTPLIDYGRKVPSPPRAPSEGAADERLDAAS